MAPFCDDQPRNSVFLEKPDIIRVSFESDAKLEIRDGQRVSNPDRPDFYIHMTARDSTADVKELINHQRLPQR